MAALKLAGLRLDVRRSLISGCTVPSLPVRVFNTEQDTAMAELSWCWQHSCFGQEAALGDHWRCLPTSILTTFFSLLQGKQSLPVEFKHRYMELKSAILALIISMKGHLKLYHCIDNIFFCVTILHLFQIIKTNAILLNVITLIPLHLEFTAGNYTFFLLKKMQNDHSVLIVQSIYLFIQLYQWYGLLISRLSIVQWYF